MSARRRWWVLLPVVAMAAPAPGRAQLGAYPEPGQVLRERPPSREDLIEGSDAARWHLGPLRVDPRLWVRDVAYVDNVFATADTLQSVSDFRATVGAGLFAYSRLGSKVMASGFLRPEYDFWLEEERLRQFDLSFGAGVFGFFNHLTASLEAVRVERETRQASELGAPVTERRDRVRARLELDLVRPVGLFGAASRSAVRLSGAASEAVPALRLRPLDRDEQSVSGGLRFDFRGRLFLDLGVERSRADFPEDPGGRSNDGTSPLVALRYQSEPLQVEIAAVRRSLDFDSPELAELEETTGSGLVALRPGGDWLVDLYGRRDLRYSGIDQESIFVSGRLGVSAGRKLGQRLELRAFAESGDDSFESFAAAPRRDDYRAYGASLDLQLRLRTTLQAAAYRSSYDSNQDEFDRRTTTLRVGVNVGGELLPW